ncbi:MAG: aminotransferase [Gammaproteobacteria bacterium]|nr:aminotransferase [Gammaproteobacteria bacterium]
MTNSNNELKARCAALRQIYDGFAEQRLQLDLTRGKPAADQLDLSNGLDGILDGFYTLQDGTDVRNYGGILGIPEARELGARLLGIEAASVLAGGNSSLNLMYHYVNYRLEGSPGESPGWRANSDTVKFLCPVPGYDRHFTVCNHFNIEMINVPFTDAGPDLDFIEAAVEADATIKGIWCIPKYSNPTGHTYSDATVERLAELPGIASRDFTIFWDNAYAVHTLTDTPDTLANIMAFAEAKGTSDGLVMFASTSKITFAGAGVAFLATSEANLKGFEAYLTPSVIGFDKVNQLRHARFLPNDAAVADLMQQHRALIAPKFELVESKLSAALKGKGIASWTRPKGGYFVSLDTLPGLASETIRLAAEVGVKLTPAGATFPGGIDPEDTNIRIAPTFPPLDDLSTALDVLVVCIELASAARQLGANT